VRPESFHYTNLLSSDSVSNYSITSTTNTTTTTIIATTTTTITTITATTTTTTITTTTTSTTTTTITTSTTTTNATAIECHNWRFGTHVSYSAGSRIESRLGESCPVSAVFFSFSCPMLE
jgi:hypothetical protein